MVDKFKEILAKIETEKGQVTLFAIMKMDDLTDKWSVVISADWINGANNIEVFQYVRDLMLSYFNDQEKATIARIVMLERKEHLAEELLKYKSGATINEGVRLNGNMIHEAYILASNP